MLPLEAASMDLAQGSMLVLASVCCGHPEAEFHLHGFVLGMDLHAKGHRQCGARHDVDAVA
jgi:hypothetical protein